MNKGLKWNAVLSSLSLYRMICTIYASKKIDCPSFQLAKTTQAQFVVNLIAVIDSHKASQDIPDVMTTCSRERFPDFRNANPNSNHSFLCKILIQIIFFPEWESSTEWWPKCITAQTGFQQTQIFDSTNKLFQGRTNCRRQKTHFIQGTDQLITAFFIACTKRLKFISLKAW